MASNPTVDSFTADIQSLRQELRGLKDDLAGLSGGLSGGSMMPSSLGRVSTNSFGGFNSSSPYSGMGAISAATTAAKGGIGGLIKNSVLTAPQMALVATGAITSMMPSMDKYAVRESGYYMAGMYSMGAMGRENLRSRTGGKLTELGGMTSVGADATVAAILSGRGLSSFTTNSAGGRSANPYYDTMISQIGNVGRYMNIDNEVAAQSMSNLTGGRTSASLMQRGIFTSNPLTGQSLKESDIFEQIANRFIVGDMSVDETQDEIRRGFLGANIESLDIDAAAKERLKMYLIARAGGEKVDFSDAGSMARAFGENGALQKAGFTNPLEQVYKINAMETSAIEGVTSQYNEGLVKGAEALRDLYRDTESLRQTFGGLNALLSTILGNDLGANLGNPITALAMYSAAGMTNAVSDITTGGNLFQQQFSGLLGGFAGLFGITIPTTDGTGGGSGYDDANIGAFALPVPSGSKISSGFDAPRRDSSGNPLPGTDGSHDGIDYAVAEGTPVRAAYDGTVAAIRRTDPGTGYGIYVKLNHGDVYQTLYGHLKSVKDSLQEEQAVRQGDIIGYSGNTGNSSGPHLHFEVRKNGEEVHPSTFTGTGGMGGAGGLGAPNVGASSGYSGLLSTVLSGGSSSSAGSVGGALLSGGGMGSSTTVIGGGGGNSVTINLSIASASEAEAVRFAEIVKQKLEEDSFMDQMGAK